MEPGVVAPAPIVDDQAANLDDSTTIFDDEQDVAPTRARVLPLVGALVGVGLLIGAVVGIVAVVTAPAWSIGIGAIAGSALAGSASDRESISTATGIPLPDDAVVLDSEQIELRNTPALSAQVIVHDDPTDLILASDYVFTSDRDTGAARYETPEFQNPRVFAKYVGDDTFIAIIGEQPDGRTLLQVTAPLVR